MLTSLMQAIRQWSLMPGSNTPLKMYLSCLLQKLILIRLDFEVSCKFDCVGSEINCVRFIPLQISVNLFDTCDNQSGLRSPKMTILEYKKGDSSSARLTKASAGADGCLWTPTIMKVLLRPRSALRAIKSNNLGSKTLFKTATGNQDLSDSHTTSSTHPINFK